MPVVAARKVNESNADYTSSLEPWEQYGDARSIPWVDQEAHMRQGACRRKCKRRQYEA